MELFSAVQKILLESPRNLKKKLTLIGIFLVVFHVIVWVASLVASISFPFLLGLTTLAYGLGLRHGVDADHIAAIDNTTRKLMQMGQKPLTVGLFFSLGHSTIVVLLSVLVALFASHLNTVSPLFGQTGALIGTTISSVFLLAIGFLNLFILFDIFKVWRLVAKGKKYNERQLDSIQAGGILAKICKPALRSVSKSWQMYFVGFLFGLGFDTATEVGLLSISAASALKGIAIWSILVLPLAFTAAMALVDTLDGILMLGAYGWAYIQPVRKLSYNFHITLFSVFMALFIGGVEAIQIVSKKINLHTPIVDVVNTIELANLGYVVLLAFFFFWIASIVFYALRERRAS